MTFLLQFFANAAADPSGFGEGRSLLGSSSVTTDGAGNASFTAVVNGAAPAGHVIAATATDPANNTSEFSVGIAAVSGTVAGNRPPTAGAGGPYTIDEGGVLTLDASASSDPDSDPLSYAWDVNGDGVFGDAAGVSPTLSWAQLQALGITDGPSSFTVRVRVNDGQGEEVTSQPTDLTVSNVAPSANAGADRVADEGQTVTLTGAASDAGADDMLTTAWTVRDHGNNVVASGAGNTLTFAPADDGVYTASFTVTDDDGAADEDTATITVGNIAPTVQITGPTTGNEGDALTFTADATDPGGANDPLTYAWTVTRDGQPFPLPAGTVADSQAFTFTPTDQGTYVVSVTVTDDEGATAGDAHDAAVANVAPVADAGADRTASEGDTVTVAGTFTDAGSADTHTLTWRVSASNGQTVSEGSGPTFQFVPTDDGTYGVTFTVTDDDGAAGSDSFLVTVANTAPALLDVVAEVSGASVALRGKITDPGIMDTLTLVVDWRDGSTPQTFEYAAGTGAFEETHLFPDGGTHTTYVIRLRLRDDDGGEALAETTVTVGGEGNALPVVTDLQLSSPAIDEGGEVTVTGSYTDADAADTHAVTIDWGDGTASEATVDPSTRTFSATHRYADDAPTGTAADDYVITATVTDSQGGVSDPPATSLVTVSNVAPVVVGPLRLALASTGRTVTAGADFTDAGKPDTHTALIDWGDGSITTADVAEVVSTGAGSVSTSHTYAAAGTYTVTLMLRDDDGGEVNARTTIVVEEVPPPPQSGAFVRDGILQVFGTEGGDRIHVNMAKVGGRQVCRVHAGFFGAGVTYRDFPAAGVQYVMVFGLGGDDRLSVANDVTVPAVIDGGRGNDEISGGGSSLLIGGVGLDTLLGGKRDDILVGGTTAFDLDPAALAGVFNGSTVLDLTTVLDDGETDKIAGGGGTNTVFA